MKTIEISDDAHSVLTILASESPGKSVSSYIENLPEVRKRLNKVQEENILGLIDAKKHIYKDLNEKFAICISLIQKSNPESFKKLDGFTKPNGRAIFISRSEQIIRESASSAKPVKLRDSDFWINIQGGQKDFEYLIDNICSALGYSPSFKSALIQKIVRPKPDYTEEY